MVVSCEIKILKNKWNTTLFTPCTLTKTQGLPFIWWIGGIGRLVPAHVAPRRDLGDWHLPPVIAMSCFHLYWNGFNRFNFNEALGMWNTPTASYELSSRIHGWQFHWHIGGVASQGISNGTLKVETVVYLHQKKPWSSEQSTRMKYYIQIKVQKQIRKLLKSIN